MLPPATCLLLALFSWAVRAADVNYGVIAFPNDGQAIAVLVDGQEHALQATQYPNLYQGIAPAASNFYQYSIGGQAEKAQRKLSSGATSTGNEFFNRSRTVYDVPKLPMAYHPLYPPLFTGMNVSNEIATIVLNANMSGINAYMENPKGDFGYIEIYNMTYISSNQIYTYQGAGIKTSGQSTKDFAKQSYKIKMDQFSKNNQLLYGRSTLKLRAQPTDMTLGAREKLLLDCLAASGAATLSGSWTRLYINGEPFGLYLMIDDATTHFIDNALHGGNGSYPYTGPTYKGNALSDTEEANLAYVGDDSAQYSEFVYSAEDDGVLDLNKTNEMQPLIELTKRIASNESVDSIVDPPNTLIHMAFNFLTGAWDGFWYQASNYYINQDIQTKKWTLITYDFDETFGNGAEQKFMTMPYTEFKKPNATRPLQDALIEGYTQDFEQILMTVVKRFFKPSVIEPILAAWTEMLIEDVTWDRSLPTRSSLNLTMGFTAEDFLINMNTTQKEEIGIMEWVRARSAAVCQQLNINDTDVGLPVLGHYTGGTYGDGAYIYPGSPAANKGDTNGKPNESTPSGSEDDASAGHPSVTFTSPICIIAILFSLISILL